MPSLTRVMILYCGQGMTTLVEIYDDGNVKDAADYLALIDCGGSGEPPSSPSTTWRRRSSTRKMPSSTCLPSRTRTPTTSIFKTV